jgi:hypothetical protein
MHFEQLWDKCEDFHKKECGDSNSSSLIEELVIKLNIYKILVSRKDLPEEEGKEMKSRTLGEILFTLTNISLIDNVNVFEALQTALLFHSVDTFSKKHP